MFSAKPKYCTCTLYVKIHTCCMLAVLCAPFSPIIMYMYILNLVCVSYLWNSWGKFMNLVWRIVLQLESKYAPVLKTQSLLSSFTMIKRNTRTVAWMVTEHPSLSPKIWYLLCLHCQIAIVKNIAGPSKPHYCGKVDSEEEELCFIPFKR